jgi:hypothetical protein
MEFTSDTEIRPNIESAIIAPKTAACFSQQSKCTNIKMEKMIKDKKERNFSFNPILVGSKMLSEDLTTSGVTLGQLREAKKWSQELHKKIANWITRGRSHSLFLEHNLELTKVGAKMRIGGVFQGVSTNSLKYR